MKKLQHEYEVKTLFDITLCKTKRVLRLPSSCSMTETIIAQWAFQIWPAKPHESVLLVTSLRTENYEGADYIQPAQGENKNEIDLFVAMYLKNCLSKCFFNNAVVVPIDKGKWLCKGIIEKTQ